MKSNSRILIVDDDKITIEYIENLLSSFGYSYNSLSEPEILFQKLESHPPDLILLDIHMPKIDGTTLLKQLKSHDRWKAVPVIVLTGDDNEKLLSRCFDLGATDFLNKPVRILEMKSRLKTALDMASYTRQLAELNNRLDQKVKERTRNLEDSHARFKTIMDSLDALVYLVDVETHEILFANKCVEELFGDTIGKRCWKVLREGQAGPCEFCENEKLLNPGGEPADAFASEFYNAFYDKWYSVNRRSIRWVDGCVARLEVATDITKRKRSEEESKIFRNLIGQSNDAIFVIDAKTGRFLDVNDKACGSLGYARSELLNMGVVDIENIIPDQASWEHYARMVKKKEYMILEGTHKRKDNSTFPVEINITYISQENRDYLVALARDITRRKKADLALQEYSQKMVESQESERKRVAGELHDGIGQNLLAIQNATKQLIGSFSKDKDSLSDLKQISSLVSQTIKETREISYNLHPHQLDQLGLKAAIESIIKRIAKSSATQFKHEIPEMDDAVSKETEINIYRIIQEGLTNIIRHSSATEADVSIKKAGKYLTINITDNGRGFPAENNSFMNHKGLGLKGINERVKILKGTFDINSRLGKGTKLKIKIER